MWLGAGRGGEVQDEVKKQAVSLLLAGLQYGVPVRTDQLEGYCTIPNDRVAAEEILHLNGLWDG